MKRFLNRKILLSSGSILGIFFSTFNFAHADTPGFVSTMWSMFVDGKGSNMIYLFVGYLGNIILTFASWFVWLGGYALNVSIKLTLNISSFVDGVPGINIAWTVLRDFCTIFFIFVLLYVSIQTIIGKASTKQVKDLIISIIIAGFFINFSLFITKAVIDATNIVATGFYDAITVDKTKMDGGLSNVFISALRIPEIYNANKNVAAADVLKIYIQMYVGALLMIIAAIVFIAGACMMLIRTVSLIGYLAISPLFAFKFTKIPFLSEHFGSAETGGQWDKFLKEAFFAPIFLAIIYIALKIIEGPDQTSRITSAVDTITGMTSATVTTQTFGSFFNSPESSSLGLMINYFILLAFFLAALKAGAEAGIAGSKAITAYADKAIGSAQNKVKTAALLPGKMAIRTTDEVAGRLYGELHKNITGDDSHVGVSASNLAGRAVTSLDRKLQNSRLLNNEFGETLRNNTTGALLDEKGTTGGYWKSESDKAKKRRAKEKELDRMDALDGLSFTDTSPDNLKAISEVVGKFNGKDFEKIDLDKVIKNPVLAAMLPNEYFDAMAKKDGVDEAKLKEARKVHNDKTFELITQNINNKNLTENFKKIKTDDLGEILSDDTKSAEFIKSDLALKIMTASKLKDIYNSNGADTNKIKELVLNIVKENNKGREADSAGEIRKNPENYGLTKDIIAALPSAALLNAQRVLGVI